MTAALEVPTQFQTVQHRRAEVAEIEDRSILLRAVPYDTQAPIDTGLVESFEPGAFSRATRDPGRVKLWFGHSDTPTGQIVGKAEEVIDRADGVLVRARISETPYGDQLRTLAADGVLDEASIEFRPIPKEMKIRREGETVHVRHLRAHLLGVALVPHGAYGRDALVLSVRDIRAKAVEKARLDALERLRGYNH